MEGGDGKAEESDFMFVEGQWWSQKGVCMCVCVQQGVGGSFCMFKFPAL